MPKPVLLDNLAKEMPKPVQANEQNQGVVVNEETIAKAKAAATSTSGDLGDFLGDLTTRIEQAQAQAETQTANPTILEDKKRVKKGKQHSRAGIRSQKKGHAEPTTSHSNKEDAEPTTSHSNKEDAEPTTSHSNKEDAEPSQR